MKIIIAGGGMGGLATAIALHQKGFPVTVLEQASAIKELGAGIQIGANATLVLRELGLENDIARKSVAPASWDFRDLYTGKLVFRAPLKEPDGTDHWGAPLYNIHRADLVQTLLDALPEGVVRLNAKCESFDQNDKGVAVHLANDETVYGDVLVGADGLNSLVRKQMRGEEDTRFAGILMWRSLIPADKLRNVDLPERGNYWTGPGRTLVTYWLRTNELYSILASVPSDEIARESWTESGDIDDMHKSFSNIDPRAQEMLNQVESAYVTGMYFRDPVDCWTSGRVTLLGDAAHPMTPYYAQGASQAFEDALTFATMIERKGEHDIEGALREYEQRRRPRTVRLQSGSRRMVKMTHESAPERIRARNGRWKGQRRIDRYLESDFRLAWGYDIVKSLGEPPGRVQGLSGTREGKKLQRPESQRAFKMWKDAFSPEDVADGYDGLRRGYDRFLKRNFPLPAGVHVDEVELFDVSALRVQPSQGNAQPSRFTILHFHGGGYVIGSAEGSLEYAHRLTAVGGGECITVDYRLAPEHPYPAALADAVTAYRCLLDRGVPASSILLSGESSGGGLAIALALTLKMAGDDMPAGIIAVCPFSDLTLSGPSVEEFDGEDPASNPDNLRFMAEAYFQEHEPLDPLVSPIFGDLSGLPPMFLTASEGEVLLSDTTRLAERARAAAVDVSVRIVEDSVHVYTIFPFLPETTKTMAEMADWADSLQ